MSKTIQYIVGLCALGFLFVFLRQVNFDQVLVEIIKVKWWMITILLSTFGAYVLATKAWQLSFSTSSSSIPKFSKLFIIRQIGETLTLINPTNVVGGELSKVYMLRTAGLPPGEVESSIVLSRGLIILSYIFLIISTLLFYVLGSPSMVNQYVILLFALVASGFFYGLFFTITSRRLLLHSILQKILNTTRLTGFLSGVYKLNTTLYNFYKNKKGVMALVFAYSLGHWLLGSLEFYFILSALDLDVTFLDALTIEVGVMAFKSIGGFVPGQIGVEEYANKFMLGVIGLHDTELWVVVSILRRARQLFWIALTFVFITIFYKSLFWKSSS